MKSINIAKKQEYCRNGNTSHSKWSIEIFTFPQLDDKRYDDGACRITNCLNLRQLEIGDSSFEDFKSFELSNVNSLQSIKFCRWCFRYADLSLKGE